MSLQVAGAPWEDATMRRRPLVSLALLVVLTVAGCEDGDDGDDVTTTTAASSTTLADASTTTSTSPAPAIVLEPEGLGAVDFGDLEPSVVDVLTDAFGAPTATGGGCELAGTTVTTTTWKELTVQFADGSFDSYSVRPRSGEAPALSLKTEDGIGLGSTKAELQSAYGSRLTIPGLPPEFDEPDSFAISFPGSDRSIRGSLSGPGSGDKVQSFFTQLCE